MKTQQEELLILPDSELRERYRHAKRMQHILALSMLVSGFFLFTAAAGLVVSIVTVGHFSDRVSDLAYAFSMAAAFVGTSSVLSESSRRNFTLTAASVTVQVLLYPAMLILDSGEGTHDKLIGYLWQAGLTVSAEQLAIQMIMIVFTAAVNMMAHPFIKELEALKEHPRFPFSNWQKDESFLSRATDKDAVRYIENTLNEGRVRSGIGEEFLEGGKKTFEPPAPDPEKNLQQRRQVWRPHDKSDTSYTMDNLKNMYLGDSSQNGELSSSELEKLLWAETAPKKPKEPAPEDFFQSAPIIWRTNRDGSSTVDRAEPGSTPAGETDSRAVLP